MTHPETLNMKLDVNKLSFPLVTCTAYSNTQFDSYGLLNSGQVAEHFPDRLDRWMNDQVLQA
jgi:hypothetical protein